MDLLRLALVASLAAALFRVSEASTAVLLSEKLDPGNVLSATYSSAIFGQDVTVQVTPASVSFVTYAPTPVLSTPERSALEVPMNETFQLPSNASDFTSVDHINVFYNPYGTFPYPSGQNSPMWNNNISSSMTCITCWFYVTFFYISQNESLYVAPQCSHSPSLFCSKSLLPGAISQQPDRSLLPATFVNASGDFYEAAVVKASLSGVRLDRLHSIATTVTPLIGFQLGQLWVSGKAKPFSFTYNSTKLLAPSNYYVTDKGQVIGVGQVVSRDYFMFFANFFASSDPTMHKLVNASQPFDVPTNFSSPGNYPGSALSQINGFQGTTTFTIGFSNMSYRVPLPPPNAGSSLVLNLPWLMASIWLAGALVLLSDHL